MSAYDLFSVLLWLVPSALLLVWFWRRARRADQELRARSEANAAIFFAQAQAELATRVRPAKIA